MNYVLETGLDFNSKLIQELWKDEPKSTEEQCLIDHMPLGPNSVTLECRHRFNYPSILAEVRKQKGTANAFEIQRLEKYQIKCPYCRAIQHGVLPHRIDSPKIVGVNWPPTKTIRPFKCSAIFKSGRFKGRVCGAKSADPLCRRHKRYSNIVRHRCSVILSSGKRSGKKCGCIAKTQLNEIWLCGKHCKK